MRLLHTEIVRFWSRRMVWVVFAICAVIMVVAVVIGYTQTSSDVSDNSGAVAEAERNTQECLTHFLEEGGVDSLGDETAGMSDAEIGVFLREDFCYQDPDWYYDGDKRFLATSILADNFQSVSITDWSEQRPDSSVAESGRFGSGEHRRAQSGLTGVLPGVAIFTVVLAILIGASFMGAEYKAGTMENLLLWEPRRARVIVTKFVAGFTSSFVLTALLLSFLTGLLLLLAKLHGTSVGVDGRFWIDVVSTIGRGALVGGMFFILAMSISVVARNTTAAVGVILGWFAISNLVVELLARWFRPYELIGNAVSFIQEGDVPRYQEIQGFNETVYSHGYLMGGFVALLWVGALVGLSTFLFARRDID